MRLAILATFLMPSSSATRAKTVFTELWVALSSDIMPDPSPSLLLTIHGFGLAGISAGDDESTSNQGGMPCSIASASTNVLKDEPG